jgi:hypothetical protein
MSLPKYWIDKYGKVIPIHTMSDEYIKNCIEFLKKKAWKMDFEGTPLYSMPYENIYHELWPVYTALMKEQYRRGVAKAHPREYMYAKAYGPIVFMVDEEYELRVIADWLANNAS